MGYQNLFKTQPSQLNLDAIDKLCVAGFWGIKGFVKNQIICTNYKQLGVDEIKISIDVDDVEKENVQSVEVQSL